MSEPHRWPERFRLPKADLALLLLTAALTVLTDLSIAIAIGTLLGLALKLLRGEMKPPDWRTPFRWGGDRRK